MAEPPDPHPPDAVAFDLEKALDLLATLEDARDALIAILNRRLAFDDPEGDQMPDELLRASEAARRLKLETKDLLRLVHERKIHYVMVNGIARIPASAVGEYR